MNLVEAKCYRCGNRIKIQRSVRKYRSRHYCPKCLAIGQNPVTKNFNYAPARTLRALVQMDKEVREYLDDRKQRGL